MARIWHPPDPDDLIERYRTGESADKLGRDLGVTGVTVMRALERHGIEVRRRLIPATDEMIAAYQGGESVLAMSKRLGISRTSLTDRLRASGIPLRGLASNGHNSAAARGRAALTKELTGSMTADSELGLLDALRQRGASPIAQRAVGPYNIDLALLPVAVEVLGSDWHNAPTKRELLRKRTVYLLNQGWTVVYIIVRSRQVMSEQVADEVLALVQAARRDPSTIGQYRVLGCDGQPSSALHLDLDN